MHLPSVTTTLVASLSLLSAITALPYAISEQQAAKCLERRAISSPDNAGKLHTIGANPEGPLIDDIEKVTAQVMPRLCRAQESQPEPPKSGCHHLLGLLPRICRPFETPNPDPSSPEGEQPAVTATQSSPSTSRSLLDIPKPTEGSMLTMR